MLANGGNQILGILMIGMLVAYNDENLLSLKGNNTAASSPFVIAIQRSGIRGESNLEMDCYGQMTFIPVLPHIVNGVIFTSAFSAGNSFLFCSSRVLYGLALRGQAPKIFARCTDRGLPIYAVLFASAFSLLSFMSVSSGSNNVFKYVGRSGSCMLKATDTWPVYLAAGLSIFPPPEDSLVGL